MGTNCLWGAFEELLDDMLIPKVKKVQQKSGWFDANLQHDLVTS
jgi:hypothetical protein